MQTQYTGLSRNNPSIDRRRLTAHPNPPWTRAPGSSTLPIRIDPCSRVCVCVSRDAAFQLIRVCSSAWWRPVVWCTGRGL